MSDVMKAHVTHLTSEEFELAIAGKPAAGTAQHLQGCERCTAEVVSMRKLLSGFREQAVLTGARYQLSQPIPAGSRTAHIPRWGMAFAAALLVLGGVVSPLVLRHAGSPATPVAVASPASQDAPSDDALLSSVQNDLSTSVPAPLLPLASTSGSTSADQTHSNK